LFIYFAQWSVPITNSIKLEEMFCALLTYVRSNRERYPQLRSAVYCSSVSVDTSDEDWIWVEEYMNREDYEAFYKSLKDDEEFKKIHDKQYDFWHLITKGSFKDREYQERLRF
jgi:hypothetical protein